MHNNVTKIEQLLYGINYEVRLFLYGPVDTGKSLSNVLRNEISKQCEVGGTTNSSLKEAKSTIVNMVLYGGDTGHGPIKLESKKAKILDSLESIFTHINIDSSDFISEFWLSDGHPAYPVFWDFAFDIHSKGQRWIFIGSSSD